ncbi:tetratricopeptide repeat protein [Flavobacterium caeni]|uniref:Tetratricopeptide repeat-containing protein n=1 Tax=Flavobacterium caeni TaxID=490189 RepID=A0A1G5ED86_9FLAO|nr:tetratricopeptide repeat protein [Flavobacterium caeni]SCY24721.1 Tetratricopeptide repeat-containing protein [Flavobacterium caeni]
MATRYLCFLFCFVFCSTALAQSVAQCDTLIKQGVEAMQRGQHVKSLELLTQARSMAKKNRWHKQEFLAINNIGANYYLILEYGEALNLYLEAYTIALKELDATQEVVVLNNIAILYSKEKKYDKATDYFLKAYGIAKDNKDDVKVGMYAMNLGNVANEQGDTQRARAYFTEALPLLKGQPQFQTLAKIGIADGDLQEGRTQLARQTAFELLQKTKDLDFNDTGISLLTIIAKSYGKENQLPLALDYAQRILDRRPNLDTKMAVFELLSELHFKNKTFQTALAYKDSILKASEQLQEIKNGKLFESGKVKFEIQNYRNELALKESRLASERKIFYSVLAVLFVIAAFVVVILRNRSLQYKQKKLVAERNQHALAFELEKEKSDNLLLEKQIIEKESLALLEQERLKSELEARNRKLSAKALYLSGRNQMIEDILSDLSQSPEHAKDTALVNHIKILKNHLKTDAEWDSFITHFEEVNQTFLNTLKAKHPSLTANDIRFIAYIYMNLSTKEIASMLNVTPEACRKRKERISAKMELPENVNLYDYLASL